MAVSLWATGLYLLLLLLQGCLCSIGQPDVGCMKWTVKGRDVCCDSCYPGNHLVSQCGSSPKDLCKPCEPDTFSVKPEEFSCQSCRKCVGAQVLVTPCTATTDTQCGCKKGLTCGDEHCTFCTKTCGKGEEPIGRSCRPCSEGTFNDQIHQPCKPKQTKCPRSDQYIINKGNAFSDIVCGNVSVSATHVPSPPVAATGQTWPLVIAVVTSVALTCVCLFVIATAAVKILKKRKEKTKQDVDITITKEPIIRRPTDEPMTLRAIECSFHEAQQEQGSSSESLNSKDSAEPLIV